MEEALEAKKRETALPRVLEEQRRMREEQRVWLLQKIKAVESQRDALVAQAGVVPRLRQELKTVQHLVRPASRASPAARESAKCAAFRSVACAARDAVREPLCAPANLHPASCIAILRTRSIRRSASLKSAGSS